MIDEDLTTTSACICSRVENKEGRQWRVLLLVMAGSKGLTTFIRFAFPQAHYLYYRLYCREFEKYSPPPHNRKYKQSLQKSENTFKLVVSPRFQNQSNSIHEKRLDTPNTQKQVTEWPKNLPLTKQEKIAKHEKCK